MWGLLRSLDVKDYIRSIPCIKDVVIDSILMEQIIDLNYITSCAFCDTTSCTLV